MLPKNRTLLLVLLALIGFSTIAAVKIKAKNTHLGVKTDQLVYLSSFEVTNNNTGGHVFYYDRQYNFGHAFSVPEGYSFVVTDIFVEPAVSGPDPDAFFLTVVNFTDNGSRSFSARFSGIDGHHYPLSGGLVIPGGAVPSARNTTFSSDGVEVKLIGYFVQGDGLDGGEIPF